MRHAIIHYFPLLIVALLWEITPRLGIVSANILPPLSAVAVSWAQLLGEGELVSNGLASLIRAGAGLAFAILFGGTLGILMAWWRPLNAALGPLVQIFYPIPKSALIPVTAIWLGFGDASKILLVFMGCLLPIMLGAFNGARSTESALVWSARSMGASKFGVLRDVVAQSALPELLNGIRTALALSFVLLVAGELISASNGLGYLIGLYGSAGANDAMYAVIVSVAALGFLFDRLFQTFSQRVLAWQQ